MVTEPLFLIFTSREHVPLFKITAPPTSMYSVCQHQLSISIFSAPDSAQGSHVFHTQLHIVIGKTHIRFLIQLSLHSISLSSSMSLRIRSWNKWTTHTNLIQQLNLQSIYKYVLLAIVLHHLKNDIISSESHTALGYQLNFHVNHYNELMRIGAHCRLISANRYRIAPSIFQKSKLL